MSLPRSRRVFGLVCTTMLLALAVVAALALGSCRRRQSMQWATAAAAWCSPPCSPGFQCAHAVCVPVCSPQCAPGWTCVPGGCVPACNPPCAYGMHCGPDRVCYPGAAPPPMSTEPSQEWRPPPPGSSS